MTDPTPFKTVNHELGPDIEEYLELDKFLKYRIQVGTKDEVDSLKRIRQDLSSRLGINQLHAESEFLITLGNELKQIKEILGLSKDPSVDYSFIGNDTLRKNLTYDNIRMEHSYSDPTIKDNAVRFKQFCSQAFLQIEGTTKYYFETKYPDFDFFRLFIEQIPSIKTDFMQEASSISDINISTLLYVFNKDILIHQADGGSISSILNYLRITRNDSFHRGTLKLSNFEQKNWPKFLERRDFILVRDKLQAFTRIIESKL